MFKRLAPIVLCLLVATAAVAQPGRGRPPGGGGGGPGGQRPPAAKRAPNPADLLPIQGVVKGIDTATARITISYEPVESLGWPAGSQPFPVAKTAMLSQVTVGQKVRFAVTSGEISAIMPLDPPAS